MKRSVLALFISLFGVAGAQAPIDSLINYIPFEFNSYADVVDTNNTVTVFGSPQFVAGPVGDAASFNGTSDYLSYMNMLKTTYTDFTFSFMYKVNSCPQTYSGPFWQGNPSPTASDIDILLFHTRTFSGQVFGFYANCYLNTGYVDFRQYPMHDTLNWRFATTTYDGSYYRFYIDSTLVDSFFSTTAQFSNGYNTEFGRSVGYGPDDQNPVFQPGLFHGLIDEIRIYRKALPREQVARIVTDTVGFTGGTLAISDNETSDQFSIYPNPASDRVSVSIATGQIQTVQLIDALGRVVFTQSVNEASTVVDLSQLQTGHYFMKVITEKGNQQIQRISVR